MRTAGLPRFRKLYGRIEEPLSPDDKLTFNITASEETCTHGTFRDIQSVLRVSAR